MSGMMNPQMIKIIETIIRFIIYIIIIVATWAVVSPFISPIKIKRKYRFRTTIKEKKRIFKHIEMILAVTFNSKSGFAITAFFLVSFSFMAFTFVIFHNAGLSMISTIISALIAGGIPYVLLWIRLHSIRVESSYEAQGLVTEIINQYKINHGNMIEAVDKTIPKLRKQPWSKKALFRLATDISSYGTKEELQDLIMEFTFAIDTQWAIELGNNIFLSIEYEDDVKEALEDILDELKDLNRVNEKNKQINNESFVMIKFVSPFCYLFSVVILFKNFHFTFNKFIDYQFKNSMGLKFFILTIASIIVNLVVYSIVKRPKNDF